MSSNDAGRDSENGFEATSTIRLHSTGEANNQVESDALVALAKISSEDRLVLSATEAKNALLIGINGPALGFRFLLDQLQQKIGRGSAVDIFLDDVTVSRAHAVIENDGGSCLLKDLGSLNGTYCNGANIVEVRLHNGDEIQIGKFRFVFLQRASKVEG